MQCLAIVLNPTFVLHPPSPPDSSPPQPLLTPHHAWARKWVPNAHAMQIASQAPRRYAGDLRRRWGRLGGESRGVGSGGLSTSSNGPLDMTRSSPERALRPRTRDFSRPSPPERRKCHGRGSRVHGDRSHGPAKITDIPVRGGAWPTRDRGWRSMAPASCCRALVCVLEHPSAGGTLG
jgi:hypothetical protein